jgi:hypothetical protein
MKGLKKTKENLRTAGLRSEIEPGHSEYEGVVMLHKYLKNVGLKGHQIIDVSGAPTCLGPALHSVANYVNYCNRVPHKTLSSVNRSSTNLQRHKHMDVCCINCCKGTVLYSWLVSSNACSVFFTNYAILVLSVYEPNSQEGHSSL